MASHHKDKTERTLKMLIYQPIKRLYGLLLLPAAVDEYYYMFLEDADSSIASSDNTGTIGSTAHLETLQYLNNKDTCLKSLNVYTIIKKFFFNI